MTFFQKFAVLVITGLISISKATPVDDFGALSVVGKEIRGKNGQVVQLRGMSLYWSQAKAGRDFFNSSVVNWLADDWHANIIRAAMGIEGDWSPTEKGYLSDPETNKSRVKTVVNAAIAKGIYVIIDWHEENAVNHLNQSVSFFKEMAQAYGSNPNVIYEIYNEPNDGKTWDAIKNYANAVIDTIRRYDPDNLIIVGTPTWSSDVVTAAKSPLTGKTNIAYTFHFYASEQWHYDHYMAKADSATQMGLPIFVTEWGNSMASGNGSLNHSYMDTFMNWMEGKKLCWCNWSIDDLSETSAALKAGNWDGNGNLVHVVSTNGGWGSSDLSESGTYTRNKMRSLNPAWTNFTSVLSEKTQSQLKDKITFHSIPEGVEINFKENRGWEKAEILDLKGTVLSKSIVNGGQSQIRMNTSVSSGTIILRLTGKGQNLIIPVVRSR